MIQFIFEISGDSKVKEVTRSVCGLQSNNSIKCTQNPMTKCDPNNQDYT